MGLVLMYRIQDLLFNDHVGTVNITWPMDPMGMARHQQLFLFDIGCPSTWGKEFEAVGGQFRNGPL